MRLHFGRVEHQNNKCSSDLGPRVAPFRLVPPSCCFIVIRHALVLYKTALLCNEYQLDICIPLWVFFARRHLNSSTVQWMNTTGRYYKQQQAAVVFPAPSLCRLSFVENKTNGGMSFFIYVHFYKISREKVVGQQVMTVMLRCRGAGPVRFVEWSFSQELQSEGGLHQGGLDYHDSPELSILTTTWYVQK